MKNKCNLDWDLPLLQLTFNRQEMWKHQSKLHFYCWLNPCLRIMVTESITISSVGELGLAFFFPWSFEHHIKMILVHKYLHPHTDDGSPSKHSFCGDACTNRISLVLSPKLRLPKVQMRALEWKKWLGGKLQGMLKHGPTRPSLGGLCICQILLSWLSNTWGPTATARSQSGFFSHLTRRPLKLRFPSVTPHGIHTDT